MDRQQPDATCACAAIRRASRALTLRYDRALAPSGLRVSQFSLLANLARGGPITVQRLADEMLLERTTVTRAAAALQRRGLVAGEVGRDRRTRILRLTPAGDAALARARPLWQSAQAGVADALGAERLGALLGELAEVIALGGPGRESGVGAAGSTGVGAPSRDPARGANPPRTAGGGGVA